MDGLKNVFTSKGMIGGFVTVALGVAAFFGMETPECTPEVLAQFENCEKFISEKVYAVAVTIAGVVSMIGRWVAKKQLTLW